VLKLAGADGVQVVCENIADPDLFPKAFATLGQDGRLVTAGSHGGGIVPLNVTHMYQRRISLFGTTGQTEGDMAASLKAASEGRLRALIDQVLPLSEAVQAHKIVEGRGGTGKVLLTPG